MLNLIQLGITFCDADGILPPGCSTWQFNFKFSLKDDLYAQDSIDMLTQAGIDFKKHDVQGISPLYFAELLMMSGVVLNDDVRWISFHSGYDFGYLLKVLTCKPLPLTESEFFELLRTYFPAIYDIKFIASSCENLKGGLNKLAELLEVRPAATRARAHDTARRLCQTCCVSQGRASLCHPSLDWSSRGKR